MDGTVMNYARIPNPLPENIGWEKVNTTKIGLDLGFLENRIFINIDLYDRVTDDMYLPGEPLPAVFGASEPHRNFAGLRNRVFECASSHSNSITFFGSELNLSIGANVSNSKGIITKYDNPNGLLSTFWEGQVLGDIWGYRIDGQFQSDAEAAAFQ